MVDLVMAGIVLVLTGFGVLALAVLSSSKKRGGIRGGGVVMIGPVPFIFGSDEKWASVAITLAIVLVVLAFLFYMV